MLSGMPGKGTPHRSFRLAETWWQRFGEAVKEQGTTRPEVLKRFILWYCGAPGAELPERPEQDPEVGSQ